VLEVALLTIFEKRGEGSRDAEKESSEFVTTPFKVLTNTSGLDQFPSYQLLASMRLCPLSLDNRDKSCCSAVLLIAVFATQLSDKLGRDVCLSHTEHNTHDHIHASIHTSVICIHI